ncbi:hypothetical protein UT300003_10520 [Clostridium sardiniense]
MLINKNKDLKSNHKFELIKNTIISNKFKSLTKYFCDLLSVSRSGYYNYINSEDKRISCEENDLKAKDLILKAFNRREYKKGSRSIKMILENELGIIFNLKRIERIMKKYDIKCPHRKSNPYKKLLKLQKNIQQFQIY